MRSTQLQQKELATVDFSALGPDVLDLHPEYREIKPSNHFVEFYETDRSLVESVRTFMSIGINEGDATLVVASPAHIQAFETELGKSVDLALARSGGLYRAVDASKALSLFMTDGFLDAARFELVVGQAVEAAARAGKNVRIYGEMVALLWEEGNVAAALELEALWNKLSVSHSFKLFCAYPSRLFEGVEPGAVGAICHQHSQVVVPTASAV